ncbi:cold shock domain-containing protein [Nocardia sp. NPDC050435]|uniref:cold-shock protein n=1 Tax=Nocardia sp. NPDC050435 TaxID=3155040 RepID=UPI00340FE554
MSVQLDRRGGSSPGVRHGRVKWFNRDGGFGFVTCSDGEDVLVRSSEVPAPPTVDEPKYLEQGQQLRFTVTTDRRNPEAVNIELVE